MQNSVIEIYAKEKDIDSFCNAVIELDGNFSFDSSTMVELGRLYFERFPDRFSNRNMEEVQHGYTMVRICVIEKVISMVDHVKRDAYRELINNVANISELLKELIKQYGIDSIKNDYTSMSQELQQIKNIIDEIPKSMIKERFVGGISNLFNIFYLLKMNIDKSE